MWGHAPKPAYMISCMQHTAQQHRDPSPTPVLSAPHACWRAALTLHFHTIVAPPQRQRAAAALLVPAGGAAFSAFIFSKLDC